MDLTGCTYSHFDAAVLLRLETKTVDYISFSASLSSSDSGSIQTEEQQYSQLPFAALICLFSTRDRPGNIWKARKRGKNIGAVRCLCKYKNRAAWEKKNDRKRRYSKAERLDKTQVLQNDLSKRKMQNETEHAMSGHNLNNCSGG